MKIQAIHNLFGILKYSLLDFKQIQDKSHPVESSPLPSWPEKMERLKNFDTSFSQPVGMLGVLLQPPPLELSPPTLPEVRERMTSLKKEVMTQIESQARNRVRHDVHQPAASALHTDTTYLQVWGLGILLLGWRGRCPGPWCTPRNLGSPERTHTLRWCLLELRTHLCTDRVTSMVPVVLPATMFTSKDTRKRRIYSFYNKVHIIKRSKRD